MTIYVDELMNIKPKAHKAQKFGTHWSHIWTDKDLEELHNFAKKIGLKRSWFQNKKRFPHYDIVPSKRKLALDNGAVEMPLIEWFKKRRNHS